MPSGPTPGDGRGDWPGLRWRVATSTGAGDAALLEARAAEVAALAARLSALAGRFPG